jgi:hypothetical protein
MPHRFPNGLPAVLPATIAQIERRLPADGEILVRMGDRVEPDDLIGRCNVQGERVLLDLAGDLGVEPRDVRRCLRLRPGDKFVFRDLLARRGGRNVVAPFSGTLSAVDEVTGLMVLTPDPMPASVTAALRGYVVDLQPNRSATIETAAAVAQGIVGFGGEQWGVLRRVAPAPGAMIVPEMIDAASAFSIVVGGAGITAEALRKAQKEQVKGVIVGGIDADELRMFWGERFDHHWSRMIEGGAIAFADDAPTLLITEGFGRHAMSRPIFDLLSHFDRQEAHLDGTARFETPEWRPCVVIPLPKLPGGVAALSPTPEIRQGAIVRLVDERHLGRVGRVEGKTMLGRLPSGVRTTVAPVGLDAAEEVTLPERALEVIE